MAPSHCTSLALVGIIWKGTHKGALYTAKPVNNEVMQSVKEKWSDMVVADSQSVELKGINSWKEGHYLAWEVQNVGYSHDSSEEWAS